MPALAEILVAMPPRDFWDSTLGAGPLAGKKFDRMLRSHAAARAGRARAVWFHHTGAASARHGDARGRSFAALGPFKLEQPIVDVVWISAR